MTTKRKMPKPSAELIAAAQSYFEWCALAEVLKPKVEAIQAALLESMAINYAPEWGGEGRRGGKVGRITKPGEAYLMSDADAARYYPALDEAYRQAGFVDMPTGQCPYLVAHHEQIQAENRVIDAAASFHGHANLTSQNVYGENRAKLLDLTLRCVAPFVKNTYKS